MFTETITVVNELELRTLCFNLLAAVFADRLALFYNTIKQNRYYTASIRD